MQHNDRPPHCTGVALAVALALGAASPALAAASMRSAAPARVDAFTGIADRKALTEKIAGPLPGARDLNVAVVLSENTRKQLVWSNEITSGVKGPDRAFGTLFAGAAAVAEADRALLLAYDPKFITDRVMQPLVARFKSVKVVGDLNEFSQGGYDLAVVLDVSFVNTFFDSPMLVGNVYEAGATINAYFVDRTGAVVEKVEVTQKRPVPRDTFIKSVADVRAGVLQEYQTRFDGVLAPEAAPPPQAALAAASPQSLEDRLKALDDLRRKGLITEDDAARKRDEILKGL